MRSTFGLHALLVLVLGCVAPALMAQDFGLSIGQHEVLESKVLGEKRSLLVAVTGQPRPGMPLLVLLDGEWNFRTVSTAASHLTAQGRLPPMVVVGVVNTDRGRDLSPTFKGGDFAAGPSDRFLAFLADEVMPHLAAKHPLGRFRILMGHSNAGMFSLYAFMRRPELFQANLALSPSFGLDDRFAGLLAKALAKGSASPRFVFLGAGGDEEADISVGALRLAKTFEASPSADLEFRYESFPGETHGSVGYRAFYRALECLGLPDAPLKESPARYLSEAQRRRHAWIRRFGSAFSDEPLPLLSVARPLLDRLALKNPAGLGAFWERLRTEYAEDFRFDPIERQNLLRALESQGRKEDAALLRKLPGFEASGGTGDAYGQTVDLKAGLVAHLPLEGSAMDLCHPEAKWVVKDAVPCEDRHGRAGKAFRFNGQGAFIEVPGHADLRTAGSLSVSAWIRPTSPVAYTAWVSQVRSDWGSQWRLGFGTNPAAQWGATTLAAKWTDYWVSGEGLPIDRWVHTAAVFDQTLGELHLYLDGKMIQTFTGLAPWCASTGPLLIGAQRDDGVFYTGDVGEVRVYNRTLNAAEVKVLSRKD